MFLWLQRFQHLLKHYRRLKVPVKSKLMDQHSNRRLVIE